MTESSNNKNFNASDIERYHAGKMSAVEMHALEKAAMEDPFLADALEGYSFAAHPQQDLEDLRKKLFNNKGSGKTVPFLRKNQSWLRAAAIIIFIAGGAWLTFRLMDNKKEDIAIQAAPEKQQTTNPVSKAVTATAPVTQANSQVEDTRPSGDVVLQNNSKLRSLENLSAVEFSTMLKDSAASISEKENAVAALTDPGIYKDSLVFNPTAQSSLGATSDRLANNRNYTNMNAANATTRMPLPGYNNAFDPKYRKDSTEANAFMKAEHKAGVTDSIKDLQIVLQPDNTGLSEVVVSKGKVAETAKRKFAIKVDTLEPKEGWAKFDDYIARNIQVPDELKTKQPYAGEVELSFDVDKNGEPVNITVTRSLCNKCDEEAIRLLKEGPKWKQKKSSKGKVTIRF